MQTEEEILESKSHVLDEALDEAVIPPQDIKVDEEVARQLQVATEQIGVLTDLYHTINEEGVSQADIDALKGVRSSLEQHNLPLPAIGLENYDGLFTPMRTSVNLKVSNESILKSITDTIKEWFYKLIDWVAKVLQWFKARKYSDTQIMQKVDKAQSKLDLARGLFVGIVAANTLSTRDLQPQYDALAGELLTNVQLPKNAMTLVAFGNGEYSMELRRKLDKAQDLSKNLLTEVSELRDFVLGKSQDLNFSTGTGDQLVALAKDIADFNTESDDPNFFLKDKDLGNRFYENIRMIKQRRTFSIEFIYSTYAKVADELRKVRRFELKDSQIPAEYFQAAFESIHKALIALREIIDAYYRLSITQWKATATFINFYLRAYEITRKDRMDNLVDDVARVTIEKLNKGVDELKASLGI
ncbi:virion structural protein [Pseudomonas phage PhiPA3]|uniref:Virion structural protein n=1 Tax=Pseudomonas phage PhiPA3 TaxID=998086 RepID=F8SJW8_BPPA3|nr:virion structural protein [Pseudomonas phage PhiPA3]AEH03513.1 virion structural protein [Pseudomonas phage PhiPA3]